MSSKTRQRMVFQRMAMAVAVAMGAWSIGTPAWPQIVADPGAPGRQRPTVLPAGQGVALVNIQTPSAAGVSRNSYRQFDVGAAGAILNNSRGQAQTQLGGWVAGNPWLATGGARIILNEVNSSDPSWLKGPIEVAGQRAEVVIANPSGIQVDGAAFLNASGVTLTTGTPVFNGGALDAYLVQGGQVRVEGAGLDARGADATAILARATQLNAALWAQRLTLVSGANTIDAASQRPTGAAPPTGEAPAFALDVAAVGGMYAGQIQLIGTEAGLGVNNQGVISAESGPLQLRADGWLVNKGSLQSEGELQVKAQGVDNAAGAVIVGERVGLGADTVNNGEGAVIAARGDLSIQARESISNRRGGLILSGADMALAAERIENRSARIEALGELDVKARVLINANEHLQTEVTTDGGTTTTRTLYFTPSGEVDASEIAWMAIKPLSLMQGSEGWNDYVRYGRPWILTRASAEALGVSDPRFNAWYHGPEPFVAAGIVTVGHGDSEAQVWQDAQFNYRRGDPIWAALGVAPPPGEPPGPMPRPPVPDGAVPVDLSAYQRELAAWQAQAAPWVALGEKLGAVRGAINAELRPFDIYQTVTETRPTLKTVHSEPGQILSGGGMRIDASERLSNQDSEIVAGGVLNTPGAAVDNQASEVAASLTRRGTAYTWGVVDHTCEGLSGLRVHADLSRPLQHVAPIHARIPLAGAVTSATGLRLVSRQFADALLLRRVQLPVVQVGAERRARSRCAPCRTGCQADSRGHAQPRDAFGYVGVQAGAFQGSLHLVLQVIEGGCRQAGSTRARRGARAAGQPTDHRVPHRAVRAAFVPLVGLGQQLGTGRVVDIKPRGVLPLLVALLVGHVAPALGEHRQAVLCDGHLRIDPVLDLLLVKDRRDAALRVSRAGVLVARDARDARFGGAARAALVFAPACATGPARPGHRPRCAGR